MIILSILLLVGIYILAWGHFIEDQLELDQLFKQLDVLIAKIEAKQK